MVVCEQDGMPCKPPAKQMKINRETKEENCCMIRSMERERERERR